MVDSGSIGQYTHSNSGLIDVTDTSNVKIKFTTDSFVNSNIILQGDTDKTETNFTFIRLGDT